MATKRGSNAKKQRNTKRYIEWPSGERFVLVEETEDAYICEGTQFLKTNPYVWVVEEVVEEPAVEEPEEEAKETE